MLQQNGTLNYLQQKGQLMAFMNACFLKKNVVFFSPFSKNFKSPSTFNLKFYLKNGS